MSIRSMDQKTSFDPSTVLTYPNLNIRISKYGVQNAYRAMNSSELVNRTAELRDLECFHVFAVSFPACMYSSGTQCYREPNEKGTYRGVIYLPLADVVRRLLLVLALLLQVGPSRHRERRNRQADCYGQGRQEEYGAGKSSYAKYSKPPLNRVPGNPAGNRWGEKKLHCTTHVYYVGVKRLHRLLGTYSFRSYSLYRL